MNVITYIGLGSNLGNREQHIINALHAIKKLPNTLFITVSSLHETKPLNNLKQPDYLNAVCAVVTNLEPHVMLNKLHSIEKSHGRTRHTRWASRTLDLDILWYGCKRVNTANLIIPHPEAAKRKFVLEPLSEIAYFEPKTMTIPELFNRTNFNATIQKNICS